MHEYIPNTNIFTIDAHFYERPELVSVHLVRSADRIAIIDTGNIHSITLIEAGLTQLQLGFDAVDFIILTHVHLDHAGGASHLMAVCNNASLIVHPKGARHMADPQRLIDGTVAVYGEEFFKTVYGDIKPIDEDRIITPSDKESIDFSGRELVFIDTPGHANHHHCIIDPLTQSAFTGDTLGISYLDLRDDKQAFMTPTTTPVQFNPEALHESINKVMSYQPKTLYLTHYSAIKPTIKNIASLHEQIDDYVMLTQQCADEDNFEEMLTERLQNYVAVRCMNEVPSIESETVRNSLLFDSRLNAQGLVFWWKNRS